MKGFSSVEELPKILYHGTELDSITSLETGIILNKGRKKTDFGQGFYLTGNKDQAENWALSRTRSKLNNENKSVAVVVSFSLDLSKLIKLNHKFFNEVNNEWAEFIYANRSLNSHLINNIDNKYDLVYGPLADGRNISLLVSKLERNDISFETFLEEIEGKNFPFPIDHQLSFHTERSITAITLNDIMEVKGYANQQ